MNQLDVVQGLGEDVVLLTRPDSWLEQRQKSIAQQLSILCEEKRVLDEAIRVKRALQDKNVVAVRQEDIIELMPLPDAVQLLKKEDEISQIMVWKSDGYDVETAAEMR